MSSIFALADCNNFYVSCERVFNPKLIGKPVIVLSNNDGCVVARSEEAKSFGIKMGEPVFKIEDIIKANKILVYSSNYSLYGDMSKRVMNSLKEFVPKIEIYSIDEAFLDLSDFGNYDITKYCREIKKTVEKWTGIPISIGISSTKTLAKIANRIAKKSKKAKGVLDLTENTFHKQALESVGVSDVWGVGRSYSDFLTKSGINNAMQLRDADSNYIKQKMGIEGVRLINELKGTLCYSLEESPPPKKGITVSRSFKTPIKTIDNLSEAIANFISIGAGKLRKEKASSGEVSIFIMTSRFNKEGYYSKSKKYILAVPSNDTSELLSFALKSLREIFKKNCTYKRAGIMFGKIVSEKYVQQDLFDNKNRKRSKKLMETLDKINIKMGTSTIKYAAQGLSGNPGWKPACKRRSKRYTTDWNSLPEVIS